MVEKNDLKLNKHELVRMWRKGSPCAWLVGLQISAAIVENSMEIPQKTKNSFTI